MRERVIAEIQRIARETGRAPGISLFEQHSGIHRREIIGKIWARWSEAVSEAGLEANAFETVPYDENEILNALADACLTLKRWPSPNDLRLFGRQNAGFPSTTTFEKRFPKRALLVEAFREWVLRMENQQYAEIADMLPLPASAQPELPEHQSYGHVYLLRAGEYYKIGQSSDLEKRVKAINVALPDKATLEHAISTDDSPGIEAYWHRRFADRRANGEWFKLSKADILAFKKRKFQ
jgi:Meiotically up-regulated gene 113/Homing endonuclease associated repeat